MVASCKAMRGAMPLILTSLLMVTMVPAAVPAAAADSQEQRVGPLLEGMGDHHHSITTDEPMTQRFFDQGLVLAYGFNHLEAERSFREAARLDPKCAMCWWGVAFVRGPNINSMMDPENAPIAWEAIQKAQELAPGASAKEQAYIGALASRYVGIPPEDRSALDLTYAAAMRDLAAAYPDDADAATLFAEALMDTTPWDYWDEQGEPHEVTTEILATLEAILAKHPDHPGAAHLYIHAVEKVRPKLAEAAADRLRDLVPSAGHLLHMPSHIYLRLGRYHDASIANQKAIEADDGYITACRKQGLYPVAYMPHNWHFLSYAATVEGRSAVALSAAREMASRTDHHTMREPGLGAIQHYWAMPLYVLTRFGRWDEILTEPEPAQDLLYPRGVWHFARGQALVRKQRLEEASSELRKLEALAMDPALEAVTIWDLNSTAAVLDIAVEVLAAEIAARRGEFDRAIDRLEAAVELEDRLTYDEPPPWYQPVRQILGAVLLEAGRSADAERIYRQDLEWFPANGWSLFGLEKSLTAQGKTEEAATARSQLETAWQHADVELVASRF